MLKTVPTLLDRLLENEPAFRRRRWRLGAGLLIVTMVAAVAWADLQLWPGVSLAFGYPVPIMLAAYVFGIRRSIELSLLCVVLRGISIGQAYGPWWLYAGSTLMLAEYLMIAVGVGLLGRAAHRLGRQARVLRRLCDSGRTLMTTLEPDAIWRQGIEAAVRLTGADGGFAATATAEGWRTDAVFLHGAWQAAPIVWWPHRDGPWAARRAGDRSAYGTTTADAPALHRFGARVQLAAPVEGAEAGQRQALVVFRAEPRLFEGPTHEVLQLFALHVGAALQAAALYRAAVQATADKGRMLAHLAQELAVPLHVVLASMGGLAAHVDEAGQSGLARLQRQERLLLELTNNVVEYARLEAGAQPRRTCVDVPELYRQVRDLALPLIGDKDVRLEVRVEPGAESVETDLERLRRIIANLTVNAVKYTPRGCVELLAARANGGIRLAVRDTGTGIARSEQARIFEPFGTGHGNGPGVGLGLALSQELARLLGTEIVVERGEQEGTTFSLLLPRAYA